MGRAAKMQEVVGLKQRKENVAKIIAWGGEEQVIICRDKNPHCGHISCYLTLTNDDDADGVCWIVKLHRGEVVDDGPGSQHGDDADGRAGHPPPLVVVSLDPENSFVMNYI